MAPMMVFQFVCVYVCIQFVYFLNAHSDCASQASPDVSHRLLPANAPPGALCMAGGPALLGGEQQLQASTHYLDQLQLEQLISLFGVLFSVKWG